MALCNASWSLTNRTALVSSPKLAFTTQGYLISPSGKGSPIEEQDHFSDVIVNQHSRLKSISMV